MEDNEKAFRDAFYRQQADKVDMVTNYLKDYAAGRYASLWTLWRWGYIFRALGRRIRKACVSERSECWY